MAILISKDGIKQEIPYYELEQKLIEIVDNLNEEEKVIFNQFKQNYHYFTPYFDFCVMVLGYVIENPMGYDDSLLVSNEEKIYILKNMNYEKFKGSYIQFSEYHFFCKCDDDTLNIRRIDDNFEVYPNSINKLQDGIIDRNNISISLSDIKYHQNLATLIVNQLIMKSKIIYDLFNQFESIVAREMNFLEDKLGYIRIGIVDFIIYISYRLSVISEKQKNLILDLQQKQYIKPLIGDKDRAEQIQRDSFRPKNQ